jgi:uncharacterized membrane protein YczE
VKPSLWRPTPARFLQLCAGLWLFGTGDAMLIASLLGNSPWTVLAEGVAEHSPFGIGSATILISFVVLLIWIPLSQRPGLGTLMNAVVIGLAIAVMLPLLPEDPSDPMRAALLIFGIALVAIGSGFYLTARLGPGPRDGLMTGLHRTTGLSLRLVRFGIEGAATAGGFLLGGRVGIGTLAFAVLIGPAVQAAVKLLFTGDTREL